MIRSMTGFGQVSRLTEGTSVSWEARSVNHRYLDPVIRLPKDWSHLEGEVRARLQQTVKRGRVELSLAVDELQQAPSEPEINWALAEGYLHAARTVSERLNVRGEPSLTELLAIPGLLTLRQPYKDRAAVEAAALQALDELLERLSGMRETEGRHLHAELLSRLGTVQSLHGKLLAFAPAVVEEYRSRLENRLSRLLEDERLPDEQRLAQEVAILADRCDITEELTRLTSHFTQFSLYLDEKEPAGRRLDFLLQEMNREANTIGSKSGSSDIARLVVEMKAELEKLREQVQNVE
ncbi:UPF0701 protein YloC [Paenibacillus sp. J31TS4]|uniref:YicC/YloC family endoribonuclease n=1 Tax=Paenibacillus sp. J31TS4 TaxID=2807195 RepID=UPI001B237155|nr:YicC/YloC family endoribonuclease [Paenibacillus sp. J31TS4]GIP36727.1 UPF0701 protein YloC [Paenibacillus sp. J31TS4]